MFRRRSAVCVVLFAFLMISLWRAAKWDAAGRWYRDFSLRMRLEDLEKVGPDAVEVEYAYGRYQAVSRADAARRSPYSFISIGGDARSVRSQIERERPDLEEASAATARIDFGSMLGFLALLAVGASFLVSLWRARVPGGPDVSSVEPNRTRRRSLLFSVAAVGVLGFVALANVPYSSDLSRDGYIKDVIHIWFVYAILLGIPALILTRRIRRALKRRS